MFRKKEPPPPKPPCKVQVLTQDYSITGVLDEENSVSHEFFFGSTDSQDYDYALEACLFLVGAQMRSLFPTAIPDPSGGEFALSFTSPWVILLPLDETGAAIVLDPDEEYESVYKADVRAGPFSIRGTVLCSDEAFKLDVYALVLRDVEIACARPGSTFSGIKAPLAVVNTAQVQGVMKQPL